MDKNSVLDFIKLTGSTEVTLIQQKFGLTYPEAKAIIDELVADNILKYESGIRYVLVNGGRRKLSDEEALCLKVLKLCIDKDYASASLIQRVFPVGYIKACKLIDWMEQKGYISEYRDDRTRKILITEEEFNKLYDNPDLVDISDKEETVKNEDKSAQEAQSSENSDGMKNVLSKAKELAKQYNTTYIAAEHLVMAMLLIECKAGEILKSCGCEREKYESFFVNSLNSDSVIKGFAFTPKTKLILQRAEEEAAARNKEAETVHVLYAAISKESIALKILEAMKVDIQKLRSLLEQAMN